ncbi:hypothetical protein JCM10908_000032 [Rhodotorula pacifica]|uniref:zinc finger MYND domain-containing protein n=1 Tax=Rhodotorula pacifica TaxID=1495444 RepID=UPI00316B89C4
MVTTTMKQGTCIVCSKEAEMRCSACFSKSGIDVLFCSPAHQKLVWPYHRQVCGDKAHPFKLPAFTKGEADLLFKSFTTPAPDAQVQQAILAMRKFMRAEGCSDAQLKDLFLSYVGHEGHILPDSSTPQAYVATLVDRYPITPETIWAIRRLLGFVTQIEDSADVFGMSFTLKYGEFAGEAPQLSTSRLWFSEWCHRLTAYIALRGPRQIEAAQIVVNPTREKALRAQAIFGEWEESILVLGRWVKADKDPDRVNYRSAAITGLNGALAEIGSSKRV